MSATKTAMTAKEAIDQATKWLGELDEAAKSLSTTLVYDLSECVELNDRDRGEAFRISKDIDVIRRTVTNTAERLRAMRGAVNNE